MRNGLKRRLLAAGIATVVASVIVGVLFYVTDGVEVPVLNPSGEIAIAQQQLILITVGLGVFVVVPVFILLFVIAWKYRASNTKATYEPELEGNRKLEAVWWGVPLFIIIILGAITWVSTHALDPYKPLESDVTPVKVEVVSLNWSWLFIYPEYNVATVNYLNIPKDTPINLSITSDAPMNSFWVPALAGQVYSMTGMATKLHFNAHDVGTYKGASANISGEGYADMYFNVHALSEGDFQAWVQKAAQSTDMLTNASYLELAALHGKRVPEKTYMLMNKNLFNDIMMKYMTDQPLKTGEETNTFTHDTDTTDHTEHSTYSHAGGH